MVAYGGSLAYGAYVLRYEGTVHVSDGMQNSDMETTRVRMSRSCVFLGTGHVGLCV